MATHILTQQLHGARGSAPGGPVHAAGQVFQGLALAQLHDGALQGPVRQLQVATHAGRFRQGLLQ